MTLTEMTYAVRERVATITFNRPEAMNAWTLTMQQELREAVNSAARDEDVRAIVLTGAGTAFCAGADVRRLGDVARSGAASQIQLQPSDHDLEQRYSYLLGVPKPLVAAINGAAAGVGLCLALYCDLRFMAEGARLTTSYARRGVAAEYGVAWMLERLVGPMNAADLLLSARRVDAQEAAAMGLVRMLPAHGFLEAVQARAAEIANSCSPRSIAVLKRQLWLAPRQCLAQACQLADAEMALAVASEDFREGVAHFLEKRAPQFTGR